MTGSCPYNAATPFSLHSPDVLGRLGWDDSIVDTDSNPGTLVALLENHRAFLRYLERRVGERALAEDILQDAFAKVIGAPHRAPAGEAVIPWFYRSLRNAVVDQVRRRRSEERALEAFAREIATRDRPDRELEREICACVLRLAATLKPAYAEALEAVEIAWKSVKTFALERGLSPGNAAARVFRARAALKRLVIESCGVCAEHGCVNCTCRQV